MEKNLLVIMILVFIILLIFAIWYHITAVIRSTSDGELSLTGSPHRPLPEQQDSPHNEYHSIIEKSKKDYENFMGKIRP
jgi:flagellar basal body-associated protein FliL